MQPPLPPANAASPSCTLRLGPASALCSVCATHTHVPATLQASGREHHPLITSRAASSRISRRIPAHCALHALPGEQHELGAVPSLAPRQVHAHRRWRGCVRPRSGLSQLP